jgi:hypothetical protein
MYKPGLSLHSKYSPSVTEEFSLVQLEHYSGYTLEILHKDFESWKWPISWFLQPSLHELGDLDVYGLYLP